MEDTGTHDHASAWAASYLQGLGEHAAVSLMYLNEGHIPDHHRDGYAPQFWLRTNVFQRRLSLAAGVGPYFYFDTQSSNRSDSIDRHGLGVMYSAAFTWYTKSRLLFQVRGNWIDVANDFNHLSVMGGIGYQLDAPPVTGPVTRPPRRCSVATGNQVTLFVGDSVLNRAQATHTFAAALEYRRGVLPYLDVTIGPLTEDSNTNSRYGVAGQVWAVRTFFSDILSFGVGVGPYFAYDKNRGSGSTTLNGLIGLTGAVELGGHLMVRGVWHRVLTNYDHDADIFLAGLGWKF
jgi:hypothetical protein